MHAPLGRSVIDASLPDRRRLRGAGRVVERLAEQRLILLGEVIERDDVLVRRGLGRPVDAHRVLRVWRRRDDERRAEHEEDGAAQGEAVHGGDTTNRCICLVSPELFSTERVASPRETHSAAGNRLRQTGQTQ